VIELGVRGQRLGAKYMAERAGHGSQVLDRAKSRGEEMWCSAEKPGQGSNVRQVVAKVNLRSRDTSGKAKKVGRGLCLWLGGRRAELGSKSRHVVG
jgi:hypothetical protein